LRRCGLHIRLLLVLGVLQKHCGFFNVRQLKTDISGNAFVQDAVQEVYRNLDDDGFSEVGYGTGNGLLGMAAPVVIIPII
jgi:hypothetical protein